MTEDNQNSNEDSMLEDSENDMKRQAQRPGSSSARDDGARQIPPAEAGLKSDLPIKPIKPIKPTTLGKEVKGDAPVLIEDVSDMEGLLLFAYTRKGSALLRIPPNIVEKVGSQEISSEILQLEMERLSPSDPLLKVPFRLLPAVERAGKARKTGSFRRTCLIAIQVAIGLHPVLGRVEGLQEALIDPYAGDPFALCHLVGLALEKPQKTMPGLGKQNIKKLRKHSLNVIALYFSMQRGLSELQFAQILEKELWSGERVSATKAQSSSIKAVLAEADPSVLGLIASLWRDAVGEAKVKSEASALEVAEVLVAQKLVLRELVDLKNEKAALEQRCVDLGVDLTSSIESFAKRTEEESAKMNHQINAFEKLRMELIRSSEADLKLLNEGLSALGNARVAVVQDRLERGIDSFQKRLNYLASLSSTGLGE